MIGFFVAGAFVFFAVGNPERLLGQLAEIASKVFGGNK
ncbi:TcpD family membrane protein [Bacillus sp. WMMC1349]